MSKFKKGDKVIVFGYLEACINSPMDGFEDAVKIDWATNFPVVHESDVKHVVEPQRKAYSEGDLAASLISDGAEAREADMEPCECDDADGPDDPERRECERVEDEDFEVVGGGADVDIHRSSNEIS